MRLLSGDDRLGARELVAELSEVVGHLRNPEIVERENGQAGARALR